jgi:hypothetical protein
MTNDTANLTAGWRTEAVHKRARTNELGDCRAGLELFTEATTLETCAVETETARDRVIAILRHRLCDLAHAANAETVKYKRERRFGQAFATGQCLEVVLRELGGPGDRTLPKPDGALPLNPNAEGEARAFLGVVADYLLGRQPVL